MPSILGNNPSTVKLLLIWQGDGLHIQFLHPGHADDHNQAASFYFTHINNQIELNWYNTFLLKCLTISSQLGKCE